MGRTTDFICRLVCMVLFAVFAFTYLYCLQSDVVAYAQHVLSGGLTHYNDLVGSVIITGVLLLLALLMSFLARPHGVANALAFVPSAAMLIYVTDISLPVSKSFGTFVAILLLSMFISWMAVFVLRRLSGAVAFQWLAGRDLFPSLWVNVLLMSLLCFSVGLGGNADGRFHNTLKVERMLAFGDDKKALDIVADAHVDAMPGEALTVYVLARNGMIGDMLFRQNIAPHLHSSSLLLPSGRDSLLMLPRDEVYRYLGAVPKGRMGVTLFLDKALEKGCAKAADYLLAAHLIDCNLDAFANVLQRCRVVNDSLPRHYREALVLYSHQRVNPSITYSESVLEADYADFIKMSADNTPRGKQTLRRTYGDTYWYYYKRKRG